MTVPAIATFDDWSFDLVDSDGTPLCPLDTSIIDIKGVAIPGVASHRLESCTFSILDSSLAAPYFSLTSLQFIRMVPYGDASQALWGVIGKPKYKYDQRGRRDVIEVTAVGVEQLLKSRVIYHNNGGTIEAINITAGKADDFAKKLVRYTALAGTCTDDIDGNSRDWTWGTLAVEADASEIPTDATLSYRGGLLYDVLKTLGDKYSFDWELRPTVAGGAMTFTFNTKYPRGGNDRSKDNTDGHNEVVINDFAAMVPSASAWRDWFGMINAQHGKNGTIVEIDATSITSWGRWEGLGNAKNDDELNLELENLGIKEGSEFEFEAAATASQCRWLAEYFVGDLVTRNNTRLGIAAADDTIAAITFSFPNRVLKLEIRWGDKEPTYTEKKSGGKTRPRPDDFIYPDYRTPVGVGAANAEGTDDGIVRNDHVHKSTLEADDTNETTPTAAGITSVLGGTNIATAIVGSDLVISGTGAAAASFAAPALTFGAANVIGASGDVLHTDSVVQLQYATDGGTVSPGAANTLTVVGGTGASTAGAGSTVTVNTVWQRGVAPGEAALYPTTADDALALANDFYMYSDAIGGAQTIGLDNSLGGAHFTGWINAGDTTLATPLEGIRLTHNVAHPDLGLRNSGTLMVALRSATGSIDVYQGGDLTLRSDASTVVFSVDGATGSTVWGAGATWTIESDEYTLPTDYPTASGMAMICTDAGVMSWGTYSLRDDLGTEVAFSTGRALPIVGDDYLISTVAVQVNQGGTLYDALQVRLDPDVIWTVFEHDLLSASHSDTVTDTVVAGDLVIGNATPAWDRLAGGSQYDMLVFGAALPEWEAIANLAGAGLDAAIGVLEVGAGTGITVNADDVAITATGVGAATYGDATHVAQVAVNLQGQITAASDVAIQCAAVVQAGEPATTWVGQIWADTT